MAEKYIQDLKMDNPYYDKYADKIAKLQQTAPEELERRVEGKHHADRLDADAGVSRSFAAGTPKPADASAAPTQARVRSLDSVIKLELIRDKTAEEIGQLWTEYFKTKDSVSAVIPAEKFISIANNINRYPTFLFPLPREQGYEFVVAQSAGNEVHFTPLINYQTHKADAPECMTMVHYPELSTDRGIVLMASEYDKNSLTAREAQCLANEFQMYYCTPNEQRRELLETFTKRPDEFKYQDLVKTLEDIQLQ